MMNACCFVGRISNDPTVRENAVFFTLAVKRNYRDKSTGEFGTDFLPFVSYRNRDTLAKYLRKGSLISVQAAASSYRRENDDERIIFKVNTVNFLQMKQAKPDEEAAAAPEAISEEVEEVTDFSPLYTAYDLASEDE